MKMKKPRILCTNICKISYFAQNAQFCARVLLLRETLRAQSLQNSMRPIGLLRRSLCGHISACWIIFRNKWHLNGSSDDGTANPASMYGSNVQFSIISSQTHRVIPAASAGNKPDKRGYNFIRINEWLTESDILTACRLTSDRSRVNNVERSYRMANDALTSTTKSYVRQSTCCLLYYALLP